MVKVGCQSPQVLSKYFENVLKLMFNCSWDTSPFVRSTVFGFLVGMTFMVTTYFGVSQTAVQRFCSLPTLKEAQRLVNDLYLLLNICRFIC